MQPRKRGAPKERTCCDCGRVELVRNDNTAERCVSCAARARALLPAAKAAMAKLRTRVALICSHCQSPFERTRSQASRAQKSFCSKRCADEHYRIDRTCKFCSKLFQTQIARVFGKSNSSGNFCSRPCYEKWLCRTGRVTGRGSQWKRIRDAAIAEKPFCGWCGSMRKKLQVHHVVPFRLTADNDNGNLIPLCAKCHKQVEFMTVEAESCGVSPAELGVVMQTILRQRQAATASILKRLSNEIRTRAA